MSKYNDIKKLSKDEICSAVLPQFEKCAQHVVNNMGMLAPGTYSCDEVHEVIEDFIRQFPPDIKREIVSGYISISNISSLPPWLTQTFTINLPRSSEPLKLGVYKLFEYIHDTERLIRRHPKKRIKCVIYETRIPLVVYTIKINDDEKEVKKFAFNMSYNTVFSEGFSALKVNEGVFETYDRLHDSPNYTITRLNVFDEVKMVGTALPDIYARFNVDRMEQMHGRCLVRVYGDLNADKTQLSNVNVTITNRRGITTSATKITEYPIV